MRNEYTIVILIASDKFNNLIYSVSKHYLGMAKQNHEDVMNNFIDLYIDKHSEFEAEMHVFNGIRPLDECICAIESGHDYYRRISNNSNDDI